MNIVLHVCCGVCAAGAASALASEGHAVTGYFYNPNICPEDEYLRRLEAARQSAQHLGVRLIEGSYDPAAWLAAAAALKDEPEGGKRCSVCFRLRLERSHEFMLEGGYDAFTSTLTISPHKSAVVINAIGNTIGGASFLARDFKKNDGFKKAMDMAKRWGLWRQSYCGCVYSRGQGPEGVSPAEKQTAG
jgi:predicted adenine nucleotide alpha hydrolase (AANH) superfamily ATPase